MVSMNYPTNYPTDSPNRRALSTEKHARPITITYNIIITWSLWMTANMAKFGIHQSAAFKHSHTFSVRDDQFDTGTKVTYCFARCLCPRYESIISSVITSKPKNIYKGMKKRNMKETGAG